MPTHTLHPKSAERLAALAGRLASEFDGEALNAARLASKLLRDHSLTWGDVIAGFVAGTSTTSAVPNMRPAPACAPLPTIIRRSPAGASTARSG